MTASAAPDLTEPPHTVEPRQLATKRARGRPPREATRERVPALPKLPVGSGAIRDTSIPLSFEARLQQRHLLAAISLCARRNAVEADGGTSLPAGARTGIGTGGEAEDDHQIPDGRLEQEGSADGEDDVHVSQASFFAQTPPLATPQFFASLARHSRLRPDLIAADMGLDEHHVRLQLASYERLATSRRYRREGGHSISIDAHPAAREVSDTFRAQEDKWAEELLQEERAYLECSKDWGKGLIRLVQTPLRPDEADANCSLSSGTSYNHTMTAETPLVSLDPALHFDAFDRAQRRPARNVPVPVPSSAPSSPDRPLTAAPGTASQAERSGKIPAETAFRQALTQREAEEEAIFAELSSVPSRIRTEGEKAVLLMLRERLRGRKRKRAAAEERKLALGVGGQAIGQPVFREAVLAFTEHTPESTPVHLESSDTGEQRAKKRRRSLAEKEADNEARLAALKMIGRKHMTGEQIREYEMHLKRKSERERARRKAAALIGEKKGENEQEEGHDQIAATESTPSAADTPAVVQANAEPKETKPMTKLAEQEEDLFNVDYFCGHPQSSLLTSILLQHLRTFLTPLIERSISQAELVAPSIAKAEKRKILRIAGEGRGPVGSGRYQRTGKDRPGQPTPSAGSESLEAAVATPPISQATRMTQAVRMARVAAVSPWAPGGHMWWEDEDHLDVHSARDERRDRNRAVHDMAKLREVTMGNVHTALEQTDEQNLDDQLWHALGDGKGEDRLDEMEGIAGLSHAYELLSLDKDSDDEYDGDESDESSSDDDDHDNTVDDSGGPDSAADEDAEAEVMQTAEEGEVEEGLRGEVGLAEDVNDEASVSDIVDNPQTTNNGLQKERDRAPRDRAWRRYAQEAKLDAKLDALDTAFDALAQADLDCEFSNAEHLVALAAKQALKRKVRPVPDATGGQSNGATTNPNGVEVASDAANHDTDGKSGKKRHRDWGVMYTERRTLWTGNEGVDALLDEYITHRDDLLTKQEADEKAEVAARREASALAAKKRRMKAATKIGRGTRWGSSRRKERGRDAAPTSSVLGTGDETAETEAADAAIGSQTGMESEERDHEAEDDGEEEADTGAEQDK